MAGFFYWLPGEDLGPQTPPEAFRAALARHALAETLWDVRPQDVSACGCRQGPDGHEGTVLYPLRGDGAGELPARPGYFPGEQTWVECEGRWLGWLAASPPQPVDLQRRSLLSGYRVTDDAGRSWAIPVARTPTDEIGALPRHYTFRAGQPVGRLKPRYRRLWELAVALWDAEHGGPAVTDAVRIEAAAAALAANYRLGEPEHSALAECGAPPLDNETIALIGLSLIDAPTWIAGKN